MAKKLTYWVMLVLTGFFPIQASIASVSPETVRATYILQIQKFIALGNEARPVSTICYYERAGINKEESVGQILENYVKKREGNKLPAVKRYEAIRGFAGCDIFYIPSNEEGNINNILVALGTSPTLTISGSKRFIYRGGMIGFVTDSNNRIKMEANIKNIRAKNIRVDSQLLEIMQQVINQ
jgi:hypothetical protein